MSKISVFDIGDTLTPARQFSRDFFDRELKRQGLEDPPEYPFRGYNEFVPESIQGWLDIEGIEIDASTLVMRYMDRKRQQLESSGILEVLKTLEKEFETPGIVSDNSMEAKDFYLEVFKANGVDIEGFVVSEEAGVRKPDPEIFKSFLERRDISGERCVYFGNRGDIDSACRKTGMEFVWVTQYDTFGTDWGGKAIKKIDAGSVREAMKG